MSPKHVGLDKVIDDLQQEGPFPEQRLRALAAISGPRRPRLRFATVAAAALCLVAGGFLMVPTRGNSLTWPEIVRSMQGIVYVHTVTINDKGKQVGERWSAGVKHAMVFRDSTGRIIFEERRDDKALYYYLGAKDLELPNAYRTGTVMKVSGPSVPRPSQRNTLDELLSNKLSKVQSHHSAQLDGKAVEEYRLLLYGTETVTADVDPTTERVFRVVHAKETELYDYPETIDPAVFSFQSRLTRDIPVADVRNFDPLEPYKIPAVIAKQGPVELRGANLTSEGTLFVTWTGEKYSRLHQRPFQVAGVKTGKPWYGPGPMNDGRHKVDAITVVNIPLLDRIGDKVTIRIPTSPTSYAVFRNVAIERARPLK